MIGSSASVAAGTPVSARNSSSSRASRMPFSMWNESSMSGRNQALPAHRGTRLLEVDAHQHQHRALDALREAAQSRCILARRDRVVDRAGPTTTNSRGSSRSRMRRTAPRLRNTNSSDDAGSASSRLTCSGVGSSSLERTLMFWRRSASLGADLERRKCGAILHSAGGSRHETPPAGHGKTQAGTWRQPCSSSLSRLRQCGSNDSTSAQ